MLHGKKKERHLSAADLIQALRLRRELADVVARILETHDAIVTANALAPAIRLDAFPADATLTTRATAPGRPLTMARPRRTTSEPPSGSGSSRQATPEHIRRTLRSVTP